MKLYDPNAGITLRIGRNLHSTRIWPGDFSLVRYGDDQRQDDRLIAVGKVTIAVTATLGSGAFFDFSARGQD